MIDLTECEKYYLVNVEVDKYRIKSIVERAKQRQDVISSLELNEITVSFIVEGYYEVIKELLVAYLLHNGLRSNNHKCLIAYFYKQNPIYEREAYLMEKLSYFRNRLNYYGEKIPQEFFENKRKQIFKIIKIIEDLTF